MDCGILIKWIEILMSGLWDSDERILDIND